MNNLSRNKPVAFVVGASSFIGSSLIEELVQKNIQVLGVLQPGAGNRDNLVDCLKDKNFQLMSQPLESILNLDLPRLDYAIFIAPEGDYDFQFQQDFKAFINICKKYYPKAVLCSSIDLYDSNKSNQSKLKYAEKILADTAITEKINARVVRLAAVYGPHMGFRDDDPMVRLIKSAILGRLNNDPTPLEFTTRALYIKDAVKLLMKAIMHGSTSQKIYDGALISPIKISEIKQVLMDPVWYEEKGFKPTQLPPWPTPNLHKTSKELSWSPITNIVVGLKETLAYFNSHKDQIPLEKNEERKIMKEPEEDREASPKTDVKKSEKLYTLPKLNTKTLKHKFITIVGVAVIFLALIYPVFRFGFEAWLIKTHLENSVNLMSAGNFDSAEQESKEAGKSAQYLNEFIGKFVFIKQINLLQNPYEALEQTLKITQKVTDANYHIILGAKLLATGISVISGEKEGDTNKLLNDAKTELGVADSKIGEVSANLADNNFTSKIPASLNGTLNDLQSKSTSYRETISLGKSLADLLPGIIASDGEKSYLVILQDNRILRPGGGQLRSFVNVTFSHGKLSSIKSDSVENLDRQFADKIEPPIELKTDLGETNWRMRDASFDVDFPVSARDIAWFYNKESGIQVSGVIAIDLVSVAKLLAAVGPLKIGNSGEEVNSTNLSQKITLSRDGNQVAANVLKVLVERIFYLSKQNWVVLAKNSEESLSQKHLLLYLKEPNTFSYLSSNGWTGSLPKPEKEKIGERKESLILSEINMTQGQDSTTLERAINIVSKIDVSGIISHKLTLDYTATEKLTGPYKLRLKVYLPSNTKVIKTTWGDKIIKDISSFSDYGMSGYSMLLSVGVGEQKQLVMDYQDVNTAKFDVSQLRYSLNIIKQSGQQSIPFNFKLTYPAEYKADTNLQLASGEISVKDQISQDKTFEVVLQK